MRARYTGTAVVLLGMLALTACAGPMTDATADAPSSSPSASASMMEESDEMAEATPEMQAPVADGAYVDYTDGIIEQTAGPKALFFHASWCPNCRQLDEELVAEGAPDGLTVFKVDYDSRTDLRQKYGVTLQTTVVFVDDAGEAISSSVLYDDPSIASLVAAIP
ncbi:thioredoxin [Microbacterium sp. SLBN-146]|nr:thioredoxin [Microbacterium sp. SLBN-146]